MITLNVLMFTLVLAKDIRISHSLVQDGDNVCSKKSLVKVVDIYPTTWTEDWDCETSYPTTTCERIRSSAIDINSVYFVKEDLICCPGWLLSENNEDECRRSCPKGYFGENCMYECRCLNGRNLNQCNAEDGTCDCLAGWTGRECDQRCSPGLFGPNCSERSIFTCMNEGINHPVTGHCLCTSEYGGSRCEKECGGIEQFDCGLVCENCGIQSIDCDTTANACFCRDGWKGRYCSQPCDIGTRGQFCVELCCSGNGYCTDEGCMCADGYHGDECQHKCEDGTFGRNCQEPCECPSCNHVTGDCDRCPFGFTGCRCTQGCLPTQWGESCNLTCSCGEDEACDVFTGECPQNNTGSRLWWLAVVMVLVILLFVGVGSVYFVCNRSSKKVQNEDDQIGAAQNDNYSTLGGTSSWSGGDYQGLRDIHTTNGQPVQTTDQIYNPEYQSTNVDTNTDTEKGACNYAKVAKKDQPKVKNPIENAQNDNYSTLEGTSSWSGGDYQALRDIRTPNGQPDQTTDKIYNPEYQSTNVDNNTDMEKGACNYAKVAKKDRPKVKNPIETAQNDNYSTLVGTESWSGGDYQALRDIHTPNGQPDQTTDQIYNPAYQSTNVDTNTDMEKGIYNYAEASKKDRPKVKNPIKTHFNNPVYNMDEILATKQKSIAQQPHEFEDHHPYEDLRHDYDNAVFTQKP